VAAWWPLAVACVALVLALVFGFSSRRAQRRIGELEGELAALKAVLERVQDDLALLDEPDPTDGELSDAARAAAGADAPGGLPAVERGRVEGLAALARDVGRAAREG
jgi:hypothetical protein